MFRLRTEYCRDGRDSDDVFRDCQRYLKFNLDRADTARFAVQGLPPRLSVSNDDT